MSDPVLREQCEALEFYETPEWAVRAILQKEILTRCVFDPCVGRGVMADIARKEGYVVYAQDVHDWGYPGAIIQDFTTMDRHPYEADDRDFTVIMNPPFSKAEDFVKKCAELGARKVVCFQRLAWWEAEVRSEFWREYPPNRIYICGDRATCWRGDIPVDEKGRRRDPDTGKILTGTPTAHAWFVWEPGQPTGTLLSHIYKSELR